LGIVGLICAAMLISPTALASPQPSVRSHIEDVAQSLGDSLLTYDYGNDRSGHDVSASRITGLSKGSVWNDDALDGAVYGEPVLYESRLYVATEDDSLYAISAQSGKVLWHVHVGTPVSLSVIDSAPTLSSSCGDINPLGITGTPVIDPKTGELFLAEETETAGYNDWEHVRFFLVALSLDTHAELWKRNIDPPGPNEAKTYYLPALQQRPAVTLFDGRLYVPLGGLYGDCGQYHGYVVALPESGRGALVSYQVPTMREGAIWETNGVLVSAQGDLYVVTGNGSSNSLADFDEGNAVVELSPTLSRLGVWAPSNWVQLNDNDWDLGSSGPITVPGTSLLFVAGKPASNGSFGYLMKEGHLGGIGHGAYTGLVCNAGGVYGADASDVIGKGATARTFIYAPCTSGTEALEVAPASMSFHRVWSASSGSPNGSPIVAGGVVFALNWNDAELYGMNPVTGHVFIERSTDSLDHFATPAVGDDLLFVPTAHGVEAFRTIS
jgi:outer membrane protein assembly factor BamB